MKKVLKLLVVIMLFVNIFTVGVSAKTYTYKDCSASGCHNNRASGSYYCYRHKCYKSGCNSKAVSGGYCITHKPKSTSTTTKKNTTTTSKSKYYSPKSKSTNKSKSYSDSYDKGYEDVYDNDDYDWDRYKKDWDYALGVDDAMDDVYEDFGDEW